MVPELTPIHWQQIEKQLQQQNATATLKRLMPQVYGAMQCELDNFRDTSLTELMDVIPSENDRLQHLIASVVRY